MGTDAEKKGRRPGRHRPYRGENCTYRSKPEEDFLEISKADNLLVHDARWDALDKRMKRLEPGFFENGKKKIAFNLLARRVGQLTSGSGALLKIRGSSRDSRVT